MEISDLSNRTKKNDDKGVHWSVENNAWAKWECQQRENIKKYQTEITELKNTVTTMKNSKVSFSDRLD